MNVAIVIQSLRAVGGAENVVTWLAGDLARRGHAVTVFTCDFSEAVWGGDSDRPYAVGVLDARRDRGSSSRMANRDAGKALGAALSRGAFDVVNAHNQPAGLWVHSAKAGNARFPPTVLFLHNLPGYLYEDVTARHAYGLPGFRNAWHRFRPKRQFRKLRQALFGYRELDRAAVRSFDKVIANSRYTAGLAAGIYSMEVDPCVLGVRPLPSPGKDGSAGGPAARENPPVILAVARIERQKNFDTLLQAIRILKTARRLSGGAARFVVAGDGPLLEHCRARSRRLGVDDVVTFLGSVPRERLRELYEQAAFVVHIPLDEPFGLVPPEAALFGKACVASDHGGPAEVVLDGVTGLHADATDPAAVAGKIGRLLDHPGEAARMGERARARIAELYAWDRFVDDFEHHLAEACRPPR